MNRWLCRPWAIALLTVFLIFLDQATKGLAVLFLKGQEPFVLWEGVFELHYLENRGAAFGMLQGQRFFFLIAGLFFRYMSEDKRFFPIRLIAVFFLAGAWGNMLDRLRLSYVVDFFYISLIDFPIFNVADIYVSVGTAVLAVLILFYYKDEDLNRLMEKRKKEKS